MAGGWHIRDETYSKALAGIVNHQHRLPFRDLADKRLYVPGRAARWPALGALIGGFIHTKLIEQQFAEAQRLAASIQQGTVTASLILRKLGAYPPAKQPCSGPARNRQDRAHAVHVGPVASGEHL